MLVYVGLFFCRGWNTLRTFKKTSHSRFMIDDLGM